MTDHSQRRHKHWIRSKKGYSGLIATIFMVLVVMYLYFGVFMFIQNQNVAFQDVTSQSQQLDSDRNTERINISNITSTQGLPGQYNINFAIENIGPVPVQLVRMWVPNTQGEYTSMPINITLSSGGNIPGGFSFVTGSNSMDEIVFWFVTARGNLISANANLSP